MLFLMITAFISVLALLLLFDYSGKEKIGLIITANVCGLSAFSFFTEIVSRRKDDKSRDI
jgi:hypothetical protein